VAEHVSYLKMAKEARTRQAGEPQPVDHEAAYRATLRQLFELAALADQADPRECDRALDALARQMDALGTERSGRIRCEEKAKWLERTGKCPLCGGAPHD
jgi:hypothetical protein